MDQVVVVAAEERGVMYAEQKRPEEGKNRLRRPMTQMDHQLVVSAAEQAL